MKKFLQNWAEVILLIVMVLVICYQGWLIKECREEIFIQNVEIDKLTKNQKDIAEILKQHTEAIIVLDRQFR